MNQQKQQPMFLFAFFLMYVVVHYTPQQQWQQYFKSLFKSLLSSKKEWDSANNFEHYRPAETQSWKALDITGADNTTPKIFNEVLQFV